MHFYRVRITETLFEDYLYCKTKCYLRSPSEIGSQSEYDQWQVTQRKSYIEEAIAWLSGRTVSVSKPARNMVPPMASAMVKRSMVTAVSVSTELLEATVQAIDLKPQRTTPSLPLVESIRFCNASKIKDLAVVISAVDHPELILNRHCAECEFQSRCHQRAVEKDDLSLLPGMTEKERRKLHAKGIFTTTQLSYTYRPRRSSKHGGGRPARYHHSLKALAIRLGKIHLLGGAALTTSGTPVYVDVEGIPESAYYYLIGFRIQTDNGLIQKSFWADVQKDEQQMWDAFLKVLEFERFAGAARDLLTSIFDDVTRYGLKARNLRKHLKRVDAFYDQSILDHPASQEIIAKYHKRFLRYRDSLFRFLSSDDIPWNNNAAERAIRHLAVQRKISGSFTSKGAKEYLRMLGISQICRFQNKSFLEFLNSGELSLAKFRGTRRTPTE